MSCLLLESGLDKRGLQGQGCELTLFYTTGPQVCVPLSALQQWTGSAATVYTIQRTNGFFGDQDQAAGFSVSVLDHDHQRAVIRSPLGQELLAGTLIVGRAALLDTMEDLIVDTLGALAVCVVGYISLKKSRARKKKAEAEEKNERDLPLDEGRGTVVN